MSEGCLLSGWHEFLRQFSLIKHRRKWNGTKNKSELRALTQSLTEKCRLALSLAYALDKKNRNLPLRHWGRWIIPAAFSVFSTNSDNRRSFLNFFLSQKSNLIPNEICKNCFVLLNKNARRRRWTNRQENLKVCFFVCSFAVSARSESRRDETFNFISRSVSSRETLILDSGIDKLGRERTKFV